MRALPALLVVWHVACYVALNGSGIAVGTTASANSSQATPTNASMNETSNSNSSRQNFLANTYKVFRGAVKRTANDIIMAKDAFWAGYNARKLETTLSSLFTTFIEGGKILLSSSDAMDIINNSSLSYGNTGMNFVKGTDMLMPVGHQPWMGVLSFFSDYDNREILYNWTAIDSDLIWNPEGIEEWSFSKNGTGKDRAPWYCIGRGQHIYNNVNKSTIKRGTCEKTLNVNHIHYSNIHYDNIVVATPPDSPVLIIHYLTSGYHLYADRCYMRAVNLPCVRTVNGTMSNWWTSTDNWFNPVTTFIIDLSFHHNEECTIHLCGMRKTREISRGVWETKRTPVTITFSAEPFRQSRRLLTVKSTKTKTGVHSKCASNSTLIPFKSARSVHEGGPKKGELTTICNGTRLTSLPLGVMHGCYTVSMRRSFFQCSSVSTNSNCTLGNRLVNCNQGRCLEVDIEGIGKVRTVRGLHSHSQTCNRKCQVPTFSDAKGDLVVYCPGNQQHVLESNLIDISCPMYDWLHGVPLYICRASYKPYLVYAWLLFLFLGYPVVYLLLAIARLVLTLLCRMIRYFRLRSGMKGPKQCRECLDTLCCPLDAEVHEGACLVQLCPYCSTKFEKAKLQIHNARCIYRTERKADLLALYTYQTTPAILGFLLSQLKKSIAIISKIGWSLTALILFLILVSPVSSLSTGPLPEGYWEKTVDLVSQCDSQCIITDDQCICAEDYEVHDFHPRKPLSLQESFRKMKKALALEKTVNINAPWGLLHIESTFSPTASAENINLSWDSEEEVGEKVLVSGKSTGILKLVEKTGMSWTLSSSKASESRMLTVSILDYTQLYKTEFIYITGDRSVSDWSHGACTGNCPKTCGCDSQTCHQIEWLHARNWGCNPTWCWGVKTGCTCCALDISHPFEEHLVVLMKTEYMGTDIAACVELNSEERECSMVSAGTQFDTGPVKVTFSDPTNIVDRLPQQVALVYKVDKRTMLFDIGHPDMITTANNLCKVQSCSHGGIGDYQMFSVDHLVKSDLINLHFMKESKLNSDDSSWMSWQGVETNYYCNPGAWPTCTYTGVVRQNKEAFLNLHKVERVLSDSFVFQTNRVSTNHSVLTWDVKAKPRNGGGEVSVYVSVDGLQLHSKKISLEGLRLTVLECDGCYGCTTGITCRVTVSIRAPDKFAVHLKSETEHLIASKTTIIAKDPSIQDAKPQLLKLFTPVSINQVCLSIEEWDLCKDCSSQLKTSCVNINIKKPDSIMLENRGTIKTAANETCGSSTVSCWTGAVGSFFKGIGGFFGSVFGSWLKGIMVFLICAGLILLLVLLGPTGIKAVFLCKRRPKYMRLPTSSTDKESPLLQDINRSVKEGKIKAVMEQLKNKNSFSHFADI
ncbi:glycoprotein precursor [Avalon Bres virus]|nr:glycoprotein precursor [Avalon Bres virus]